MAFSNRAMETTTSTGTGNLTTAGAVTGYRTLNAGFGTNVSFEATIEAVDGSGVPTGDWEVSVCYLSAATTLVRERFIDSSTGATINFSAGTKRIFNTYPAHEIRTTGTALATMRGMDMP